MDSEARAAEIDKYCRMYRDRRYRMGRPRWLYTASVLRDLQKGSLLDVGAGRGETLDIAQEEGFSPVCGTEVVPDLLSDRVIEAPVWDLPFTDGQWSVVTCLDVLEHLLPDDSGPALDEIARVTGSVAFLSIANHSSVWHGEQLHVNRLPFEEWDWMIKCVFPTVRRLPDKHGVRNANWLCRI